MTAETHTGLPLTLHGDRATVRRIGAASPSRRLESPRRHREPPDKSRDAVAPYRSKLEGRFAKELDLLKRAGAIKEWAYETLTFKLATRTYHRIDFLIWHHDHSGLPSTGYYIPEE